MQAINLSKQNLFSRLRFSSQRKLDAFFTLSEIFIIFLFLICLALIFQPFTTSSFYKRVAKSDESIIQIFHSEQANRALNEYVSSISYEEINKNPDVLFQMLKNIRTGKVFIGKVSDKFAVRVTEAKLFLDSSSGKYGIQTDYKIADKSYTSKSYFLTLGALPVTSQF